MLTGFQLEVVAGYTEYGDLLCLDCASDAFTKPIIRYNLDEEQSARASDGYCARAEDRWDNDSECGCEPAVLCDSCGDELLAEYDDEWYHEREDDDEDADSAPS